MLSQRAHQGILAMAHVAQTPSHRSVTVASIAQFLELSVSYTESLVKVLKQNDLLQASRGPGGGYQLKKDLQDLTAWDVVRCFEIDDQAQHETRPSSETVAVDLLYEEYARIEKNFLQSYSLSALVSAAPASSQVQKVNNLPFNFKPLPKGLMPVAPNSVFDLSKFMQLTHA
ncbi:MAG: HTH-type transcriptional regulator IscR [Pseudomonadota bacterium]|jgi:Rrf2 family protein